MKADLVSDLTLAMPEIYNPSNDLELASLGETATLNWHFEPNYPDYFLRLPKRLLM